MIAQRRARADVAWCALLLAGCPDARNAERRRVADAAVVEASVNGAALAPDAGSTTAPASVIDSGPSLEEMRHVYDTRFSNARVRTAAWHLFEAYRIEVIAAPVHSIDGGYRGTIHFAPSAFDDNDATHVQWVARAFDDMAPVFEAIGKDHTPRYVWKPRIIRFCHSTGGKRTPAAYAGGDTITYNTQGTLHVSAEAVRETLVHEVFHLNDNGWSPGALGASYDAVKKKCGTAIACLAKYSPGDTIVRGGTYYAFQPGNDVGEYAAELMVRFFREHRALTQKAPPRSPWKCAAPENAAVWTALSHTHFDDADLLASCPHAP